MPVTHLSGPRARIDVTLDGITFTRTRADAVRRGTAQQTHVAWDDVLGASLSTTGKGRTVLRLDVTHATEAVHHKLDPHALKVPRSEVDRARLLVEHIDHEVAVRRRWRRHDPASG